VSDQDIPFLDSETSSLPRDIRADLAEQGRNDLYFFAKGILGYKDIAKGCHGPLCVFLDSHPSRFKMIQMPRGHFKTTIATISRVLQKVCRDTNQRILLANETSTNAERFLSAVKQHCESNQVFRALYSDIIPKDTRKVRWNNQELEFNRQWRGPEPTIDTVGMTGAMTSRHYTHITIDDPISEEAAKSEKVMQDVISRIDKIISLMVKPEEDTFDLTGTRWAFHDVYSYFEKKYGQKLAKFIRGAIEEGEPIFPELISLETLAQARENMGEYMFSCLYMNNPRNEDLQDFNIRDLRYWRWNGDETRVITYTPEGEIKAIVPLDQMDIVTTVDLAPAETISSDRNAVITTGTTASGDVVVLDAWAKRCSPLDLMRYLIAIQRRYNPRVVGIEGVAYQKAFKHFLRAEGDRERVYLNIRELSASGKKELRIRGLQPIAATGHLYILPTQHILRNEMAEFPLGEHDDCIDALAYQLQLWQGLNAGSRWDKYKESERKLLRKMRGYSDTGLIYADDDSDDDVETRTDSWTEHYFA